MAAGEKRLALVINTRTCMGSGQCYYMQPKLFEANEDGTSRVRIENPEGPELAAARDAAEMCPSQSIRLVEAGEANEASEEKTGE